MINKFIGIGNLGRDPEIRYTPSGDAVANYSIACSEKWKDKQSGEMKERTEWVRCVSWGRLAEIIGEYCHKGKQIYVEGKLQTRQWEKDGTTRYTTEVVVHEMKLLGGKGDSGGQQGGGHSQQQRRPSQSSGQQSQGYTPPQMPNTQDDDDIPF